MDDERVSGGPWPNGKAASGKADSITTLKARWAERFPRRANGGWWSLSGFSIQMIVALERFLKQELIDHVPREEINVEAVSDVLLGGDRPILIQVKRNLTKKTLGDAYIEAYDIASLCEAELLDRLRFQVVCETQDSDATLEALKPDHLLRNRTGIDTALIARTFKLFDEDEPIKVASNPTLALRRVLWNAGVLDPVAVMNIALGKIMTAFNGRDRDGVESALYEVQNLVRLEKQSVDRSIGQLFLPGDLDIASDDNISSILVEWRPRVVDLRRGRFHRRVALLNDCVRAVQTWLALLSAQISQELPQLPVFCIRGLPADGKSVLLLQLVSQLLMTASAATITQLISADELEQWFRSRPTINGQFDDLEVELAFLDGFDERLSASQWESLVEEIYARGSPSAALITCGTIEGMSAFSKAQNLTIAYFDLPAPTAQDYAEFDARYGAGRGRSYTPGVSLAAMLVGLVAREENKDRSLAAELCRSLLSLGVWEQARAIIAANLLGLPAPINLIPDSLLTQFEALTFEIETLVIRVSRQNEGFHLGHAAVLWPIYVEWAEASGSAVSNLWGADLGRVLAHQLRAGQVRIARETLGRMLESRALIRRLGAASKKRGNPTAAASLASAFTVLSEAVTDGEQAPLMRQWLFASGIDNLRLEKADPLDMRVARLLVSSQIGAAEKAEMAAALLSLGRVSTDASRELARKHLINVTDQPGAIFFFTRVMSRVSSEVNFPFVRQWLLRHRDAIAVAPVLTAALRNTNARSAEFMELGYRLAESHAADPASGPLTWALLQKEVPPIHRGRLDAWLARATDTKNLLKVYSLLLKRKGGASYATRARRWAEAHCDLDGLHDLLARLILIDPSPDVVTFVDEWMERNRDTEAVYPVLGAMLKQSRFRERALPIAIRLLDERPADAGTPFLFSITAEVVQAMVPSEAADLRSRLSAGQTAKLTKLSNWRRRL